MAGIGRLVQKQIVTKTHLTSSSRKMTLAAQPTKTSPMATDALGLDAMTTTGPRELASGATSLYRWSRQMLQQG